MNFPRYLQVAIALAEQNQAPKWKLAAVGTLGGSVLGVGINTFEQNDSPPGTINWFDLGRHAETNCLRACGKVPKTIYVARATKKGLPALALPCRKCYSTLVEAGVKRVIFTVNSNEYGTINLKGN